MLMYRNLLAKKNYLSVGKRWVSDSEVPDARKHVKTVDNRNLRVSRAVYGCGLTKTGSLAIRGVVENPNYPQSVSRPLRIPFCNGKNIKKIAAGFGFSLFASSKKLYGSGLNNFHQIGGSANRNQNRNDLYHIGGKHIPLPGVSGEDRIVDLSAGRLHSLVALQDRVYAFGDNSHGQCGQNPEEHPFVTHTNKMSELRCVDLPIRSSIKKVHCSYDTSFVLTTDGKLFSFGLAADGQTGTGVLGSQWKPTEVSGDVAGEDIVDVGGHADTLLAVNRKGDLFCWGLNEYGQFKLLSDDIQLNYPRHLKINTGSIVSVAATGSSCGVVDSEGRVFTWGAQILGMGPEIEHLDRPTLLDPPLFGTASNEDSAVVKITSSPFAFGALTASRNLFVWGTNRFGTLGLGHSDDQYFPFQVFIPEQIKDFSIGPDHSIYLTK